MNQRQKRRLALAWMPTDELERLRAQAQAQYDTAKQEGHCALEAVLYFDLQQVLSEIERRNLTPTQC